MDEAQYVLGVWYAEGNLLQKNDVFAYMWFNLASQTLTEARLARDKLAGTMTPEQICNAQKLCEEWKSKGESEQQDEPPLSTYRVLDKDRRPSGQEAAGFYHKAAEQGNADAQYYIGLCYQRGDGVPQNNERAAMWFAKAAEQGHALAQYSLGRCYYTGEGVPQDYGQAVMWYRNAAENGNVGAQTLLDAHYARGEGVSRDYEQAVVWWRKAAEQGDAEAQCLLGGCYQRGEGAPQDYEQAVNWFRKAAEQGDALAQHGLALCYKLGTGLPQDKVAAYIFFSLAAATLGEARAERDRLKKNMTTDQVAEAQRLSHELKLKTDEKRESRLFWR